MHKKIKVDVNLDELVEGQQMILTLADQEILNGQEVNDDDDILENHAIKEKDKIEFRKKQIEKIKKKNHTQKYEEHEEKKGILEHYDEDVMTKEGFYIDHDGKQVENEKKLLENIQSKLKKTNQNQIQLMYEDKVASDYKSSVPSTFQKKKIQKYIPEKLESIPIRNTAVDVELDDYEQLQNALQKKKKQKINMSEVFINDVIDQDHIKQHIEELPQIPKVQPISQGKSNIQEITEFSSSTDFLRSVEISNGIQNRINQQSASQIAEVDKETFNQLENVLQEEACDVGLANTLKLMRQRGDLNNNNYNYSGRSKDSVQGLQQQDDEKVKLEYRDSSGRLMTPKEAFRYQCWIFHGEGPSKNKIEKKKKKDLYLQKQKMSNGQTSLMKTFEESQKRNQSAYLTISQKNKIE